MAIFGNIEVLMTNSSVNTTQGSEHVIVQYGSRLVLPLFLSFVVVVFMFHFYLKYDENKRMKMRRRRNEIAFQWLEEQQMQQ